MKKTLTTLAASALTVLALAGCAAGEPETTVTKAEICAPIIDVRDDFMSAVFANTPNARDEYMPMLRTAQAQASEAEETRLDDALRDLITVFDNARTGRDGYVNVSVALDSVERECEFA